MADAVVLDTFGRRTVTAGSTAVSFLDLVYFDGTDWELADASALATHATAVVVSYSGAAAGDEVEVALMALVSDADVPYTEQAQYYLSATAGETTTTAPTGTGTVDQIVAKAVSDGLILYYPGIEIDGAAALVANA